jgi:hypothetical protein
MYFRVPSVKIAVHVSGIELARESKTNLMVR